MVDSNNPFDLLKDEMSNDDTQIKVNAIHRLSTVMALMTPEKLVSDLIPYINKLLSSEEDEVLLAIAENLSKFRNYLKDDKFSATFPLFQILLCAEETVVRETIIESLREIIKNLPDDIIYSQILPIIYNISNQENFTGRVSACYMVRMVYQKAGKDKEKLRSLYFKLCDEDLPLTKRAAAKEFGHLCMVMEKEVVNPDMINYFKKFMNESDSIRVLLLSSLVQLVKLFQNTDLQRINVQVVVAASDDKSWRVRHELARIFPSLIEGFGSQINELVPTFANLIKDSETEVKIAALEGLEIVIKSISSEKVTVCIIPAILSLANESSFHVKCIF
jgi:serine/threonine-protein phosphatase 2A regulatory subunit A